MKKIHMIAALLAMLMPTVLLAGNSDYYAQLTVKVASDSTGLGKVYAGTSTTAGTYNDTESATEVQKQNTSSAPTFKLYAFAQANSNCEFLGWSENGTLGSNPDKTSPKTVSITGSTTSPNNKTYYAHFIKYYNITLAAPDDTVGFNGYTYSGDGISGTQSSSGGTNVKVYDGKTYTFTCNLKDTRVYKFAGWDVGGSTVSTANPYSTSFSAATTIKAVIAEKDHCTVTLVKPTAGFSSYSVTGNKGFTGTGLSNGGNFSAYHDETYTFTCAVSDSSIYELAGWEVDGTVVTTDATLTRTFSPNTAATVKAIINTKEQYRLTLTKPTGVISYAVTGLSGADGLSNGGTLDFFGSADFTFNCTLDDNYKFLNWSVTDGDGTSAPTTRTLSKRVSSNTSVAAVVAPKETYSLTLEKPEGVTSYTVTATPGGAIGSLSDGGTTTVREQDPYQFECAINDVEYVFVKWLVRGANGSTIAESEDRVFTTTFNANATVSAVLYKKGVYELTFVQPEQVTSFSITGPNGLVSISEEGEATVYELDEYQISCAFDEENWELVKWTITDTSGTTEPTTETLNNKTFTSDARVTVTLNKVEAFIATCLTVPSGCSYKVGSTTVSTTEHKVRGEKGQPLTVTLSAATASSGYLFAGWYIENQDGSKTYISKDSSMTQTFNSHVKIGADFVSSSSSKTALVMKKDGGYGEYDDLSAAFDNLEAGDSMYIYNDATIDQGTTNVVYKGTTLTLSSGVTLTVNGTLAVAGTVAGSGTIAGSGTLMKISYLITQGGVIIPKIADGRECEKIIDSTYFKFKAKYRKTTVVSNNPSIPGSIGCTESWGVLLNENAAYAISKQSPKALKVTFNTSSAVNEIKSIVGVADAITESAGFLLLADCNLTGPTASNGRYNFQGTVDCAGKKLTASDKQFDSNFYSTYVNGSVVFNGTYNNYFQNGKATFINCSSAEIKACKGTSNCFYFFDCGTEASPMTVSFTYYPSSGRTIKSTCDTSNYRTAHFYSGFYNYEFVAANDYNTGKAYVYGGAYKYNPSTSTIKCLASTYNDETLLLEVLGPNTDNNPSSYYKVQTKGGAIGEKVVQISGKGKYETLQEAVEAASNGDTLLLLTSVNLAGSTVTVNKALTISLESYTIAGGKIVNSGTLLLTDDITGTIDKVTSIGNGIVTSDIENNGTLDIVFGTYKGTIVNKAGSLTTHNGLFSGALDKQGGSVVIKGGHFSKTTFTKEALTELGIAENCKIVVARENGSAVNWYSVCKMPDGTMTANGSSGYKITPYSLSNPDDFNLILKRVKNNYASRTDYSESEWERLAELLVFYQAFNNGVIDATLLVDRKVTGGSLEFNGSLSNYSYPMTPQTMAENSTNRLLSAAMVKNGWTAMAYKYFFTHQMGPFQTIGFSANSTSSNNDGTICMVWVEIWDSVRAKDYTQSNPHMITNSLIVVGQKHFAIGAESNKAMIRPATGAATFYGTLSAAMSAVTDGGTVMLANDCTNKPHFATAGTYIVDSMGFVHSFSGAEGGYTVADGLSVTAEPVTSSVAALIPSAVAIKYVVSKSATHPADFVVIPSVPAEWEAANGLDEGLTAEDLKHEDTNGNATWENAVMGQDRTTPAAIVTSTNGTETTANMEVSFKPPSNIGYRVRYAFDEVAIVGTVTNVVNVGSVTNTPTLDLSGVTTNSPSYFKMRAVLESTDDKHTITTNVPVEHVVGVMKVDSDATYTIIAVPWTSFDGSDVKVSELVHAASLSEDDTLYAYRNDGSSTSWLVKDGTWVSRTEVENDQSSTTPNPAGFGLARGKGVWLKRSNTSKPIYLMGMPTTEAATNTLAAAVEKDGKVEPSWNLLASPNFEQVDIASKFKDNTADEIIVPTAGTPKHYTYTNNVWGYPGASVTTNKTVKLPNGQSTEITIIQSTRITNDTTITPGTGFWYLNKSTESEKTVNW